MTVDPIDVSPDLTPMKLPTYTHTAGLDRFPPRERFAVYRATHQRLLAEDRAYHQRWQRYIAALICLTTVPVFGWIAGIVLVCRQQEFQNLCIGAALTTTGRM